MKNLAWLLMIISFNAFSVELILGVNTFHAIGGDYNNDNKLVAIESNNVIASTFVNSYSKRSVAMAYDISYKTKSFDVGAYVGGVSGYCLDITRGYGILNPEEYYCGVLPLIAPTIKFKNNDLALSVSAFGPAIVTTVSIEI